MFKCLMPVLFPWLVLEALALPVQAATLLGNADDLLQWLVKGLEPVAQVVRVPERGCGPKGCFVNVGDLAIWQGRGSMMQIGGRLLQVQPHEQHDAGSLPAIDWRPLSAYTVLKGGAREWGLCLEFAHEAVGRSGTHQQWTTTVLVPRIGTKLGPVAHRFVGYWSNCNVLADGGQADEVLLPVVERGDGPGRLQLVWYRCAAQRCVATLDRRTILPVLSSKSGELVATDAPASSNP